MEQTDTTKVFEDACAQPRGDGDPRNPAAVEAAHHRKFRCNRIYVSSLRRVQNYPWTLTFRIIISTARSAIFQMSGHGPDRVETKKY